MLAVGGWLDGPARLAAVGAAHTASYAAGGLWLAWRLRSRVGSVLSLGQLRPLGLALALGGVAWAAMSLWSPEGRGPILAALAIIGVVGAAAYVGGLRVLGAVPSKGPAVHRAARALP
jgi:hypothetical protein